MTLPGREQVDTGTSRMVIFSDSREYPLPLPEKAYQWGKAHKSILDAGPFLDEQEMSEQTCEDIV